MGQQHRFKSKRQAIGEVLAQQQAHVDSAKTAIKIIEILYGEAETESPFPEGRQAILDFLSRKKIEMIKEAAKIHEIIMVLKGRIQQCDEFVREDDTELNAMGKLEEYLDGIEKQVAVSMDEPL